MSEINLEVGQTICLVYALGRNSFVTIGIITSTTDRIVNYTRKYKDQDYEDYSCLLDFNIGTENNYNEHRAFNCEKLAMKYYSECLSKEINFGI